MTDPDLTRGRGLLAAANEQPTPGESDSQCRLRYFRRASARDRLQQWLDANLPTLLDALDAARAAESDAREELGREGERWAEKADQVVTAVGVVMDLCEHATPIAHDAEGFVAVGYTVTVGAIHRALAFLQGAAHNPPEQTAQTWGQFQEWLVETRAAARRLAGEGGGP